MSDRKNENCLRYVEEVDVGVTPKEEVEPSEGKQVALNTVAIGPNVWQRSMWICHVCKAFIDVRCCCNRCGSERVNDAPTYTVERSEEFDSFIELDDEAYERANA